MVLCDDVTGSLEQSTYILLYMLSMLWRYHQWIWILVFLGHGYPVLAQQLSFRYLGKDQGLNSLASWNCAIDHHGFLWIASSDGLVRFNGKETSYYVQQSHPEMPADQIGFIFCDSRNRIWVCFNNGLVRIDENRQFKRQIFLEEKPAINTNACIEDHEGTMYALTTEGAFSSRKGEEKWESQPWLDSLVAGRRFRDIRRFDQDHYLIVFPTSGVMLVNMKERKQEVFVPVAGVNCATRFDDKSILIGKHGAFELLHVSLDNPTVQRKIQPPPFFLLNSFHEQINYIVKGVDQKIYMTTSGAGVVSLDSSLTHYTHYAHDPVDPSTIISNSLRYIVTDSAGSLMITSLDGVNFTNVHNSSVEYVNYLKLEDGEIIDKRVISIAEDRYKKLWLCTTDNVYIYDHERNSTKRIIIPSSAHLKSEILAPIYVECDQFDNLWVALRHEGIAIFFPDGTFRKFISAKDYPGFGNSINDTRVIREGNDGYMYLGTEKGLFRMSHDGFALDTFADHPALAPLRAERIVDIYPIPKGIWISSSPGGAAWHYSFTDRKLKSFDHKNGLPTNRVYRITGDRQGNLYVGSNNGLSIISADDRIRNLTKGQGLISPRIESNETADDGSVWMTNNYNLLKYTPQDGRISKLGSRQGLTKVNFAIMGSVKLSSGNLVFGANKGFIIVDPKTVLFGKDSLKIFVFYQDPQGREMECVPGKKLNFNYNEQNIHFSFAVNDLIMADQMLFKYQLTKNDEGPWSNPSLNASADFNLDPGSYSLNVQAYNGHTWFELESPIHFHIKAPWWRQRWFIILMGLLMAFVVWTFVHGRFQKIRRELLVTRQIADLEAKALRAQMNPHFVFNSLNAIQECIVTGKVEEAYAYLSQFARLLRLVLEHSDMADVSLHDELEVLSLFVSLEKLRFRNDMQYTLKMEKDLDDEEIRIPPMLIQPHLENAIWHGLRNKYGEKQLSLSIAETIPGYLEVVVEDNGVGRVKAAALRQDRLGDHKHKSIGKQLSGNRLELLRKNYPRSSMEIIDLYDGQGLASGTRVILVIPISDIKTENKNKQ